MTDEPKHFDLIGELPLGGRLLIEASAGTGKTSALAGLATRYIAETETTVDQLLIVTFGRLAADELRDRVRSRMAATATELEGDGEITCDDELVKFLASSDRERRRTRLKRAVADFDAAAVATIHSFAQQIRHSLGSGLHADVEAVLRDDTDELLSEVVSDVLAMEVLRGGHDRRLGVELEAPWRSQLIGLAKIALSNPEIVVLPGSDEIGLVAGSAAQQVAATKSRLLAEVLAEVSRRRRLAGTISYDEILTQLQAALRENTSVTDWLRRRFPVALVDEFQDTDPVQWEIFERAFGAPDSRTRLVLVGDPKQAIYGFRGANVFTYLEAKRLAGIEHRRLATNYRSDGALVAGVDRLFRGATLGDREIDFQEVEAAPANRRRRLANAAGEPLPALCLRVAVGSDLVRNTKGAIETDSARRSIARDLAARVHDLLERGWVPEVDGAPRRAVRPSDIAVLVSKNAESSVFQSALGERNIPAVIKQGTSVLDTDAADQWRDVLDAMARPSDVQRARRVALGWFFGKSARWLASAGDGEIADIQNLLDRWSNVLAHLGVIEFCSVIWAESGVVENVLSRRDGDRNMTDLNQISGLLQRAARDRPQSPITLLRLFDRLEEIHGVEDDDLVAREVESETTAVQILTVHTSKGLEFPIVCVPSMWVPVRANDYYQDPERAGRVLAVDRGAHWPDRKSAEHRNRLAKQEAQGENMRLLYVALTRARHQTIVWWTRVVNNKDAGLTQILFGGKDRGPDGSEEALGLSFPDDVEIARHLATRLADPETPGTFDVVEIGAAADPISTWSDPELAEGSDPLDVARFTRNLDRAIRRWSFSAMTPSDDSSSRPWPFGIDPGDESEGDAGAGDERDRSEPAGTSSSATVESSPLPMGEILGGTRFGTLVHEVLQEVDFAAPDLAGEIGNSVRDRLRFSGIEVDPTRLTAGLCAALTTPLGDEFQDLRLADLKRSDRLDELAFEMRLGEGGRRANLRELGHLVRSRLAGDDPLFEWAGALADGLFEVNFAGHLTGSIDLVMRTHNVAPTGVDKGAKPNTFPSDRFYVVDYKTNVLTVPGHAAKGDDYRQDRLARAMVEHHYPLQALLYTTALHRYLRWRIPEYDVSLHLAGAAYLFVRGMSGSTAKGPDGHSSGVFTWRLPPDLIVDLSDLLDGALAVAT